MAKINQPPQNPWPWGLPDWVAERIVVPQQVGRRRVDGKKPSAKSPPLASTALLDFIGPAHASDELRLPAPELASVEEDAPLQGFMDRPHLMALGRRAEEAFQQPLEEQLMSLSVPPERQERMRALLMREAQMLEIVQRVHDDVLEIERRRREEQGGEDI